MNSPLLDCVEIETAPNPTHAVIWLHGLGADGHDFASIVPELRLQGAPAIRFVFPHAPVRPVTVNNGMAMRAWYDIYVMGSVQREDESGFRDSQRAVEALIARENQRGIESRRIVLAGFSQGCAMTLYTGPRFSQKLAGMVGLSGYLPLAGRFDAERQPANQDTPIFLAHGTQDPVVAIARGQAAHAALSAAGYPVSWQTYAMPHSVCLEEIADIAKFLRQVLM